MTAVEPKYQTVLLDMDGVLAEVSRSYRSAILATCHHYGANSVSFETITDWKARGNANDDWQLSYNLIRDDPEGRNDISLEQVTATFEDLYQGTTTKEGLYKLETLIPARETLEKLRKRSTPGMGIVTGRPRKDCMTFLKNFNLEDLFDAHYCMEDGPSKPDPYPVRRCCELLGVEPTKSVILVGDTPDDIQAAISAGITGVGVTTPEAAEMQEAKGKHHSSAKLSVIMKERGADVVLPPGFVELVDFMKHPN
ncbi:predicted protein [Phaeodactylum tricornutum CCAP 1055/1]|jgi:HAD superfamily hydrolase (TIGR01548 family)|uniref:HAD family hydrolase n=1 Tax=Phaeodactylum tricornutum (strain CCAP 1055/1) TaxID=556484 RepID=B7FT02_PHATC|nr:predicted protein [Phaeodactylum tricornutum CCAP 1055/1]EEC50887.1 predicted protein [Phaeodactylum tricornutum CCAP 1055/1]|eukprot:XP_002178073.1 predicted protein [Phaeodactylum tricornutum CCAP 1055/1]